LLRAVPNIPRLTSSIRPALGEGYNSSVISILGFICMTKNDDTSSSELFDHESVARDFAAKKRKITVWKNVSEFPIVLQV